MHFPSGFVAAFLLTCFPGFLSCFLHPVLPGFVLILHLPRVTCALLGSLVESVAQGDTSPAVGWLGLIPSCWALSAD